MRKELVFVLLALFLCAGCNGNKKKMNGEHDSEAVNITLDDHTISFYYNWYGNPLVDGEMKHWMHPIAPAPGHSGDAGAISGLNDDIACNFYPELGTYSSNHPETYPDAYKSECRRTVCHLVGGKRLWQPKCVSPVG